MIYDARAAGHPKIVTGHGKHGMHLIDVCASQKAHPEGNQSINDAGLLGDYYDNPARRGAGHRRQ